MGSQNGTLLELSLCMEMVNSRNLIWLSSAVVLALILRWVGHHFVLEKDRVHESGYSYEMPHPESEAGKLDLEGRSIDRMVLENNKVDKRLEVKKPVVAAAATSATNKVFSNTAATSLSRQAELSVSYTDSSRHLGLSSGLNSSDVSSGPTHVYKDLGRSGAPTNPTTTNPSENSNNKTPAEWKALLQTNNPKAMADFIQAHEQGHVTDSDFYSISVDLLLSGNESLSKTGQQILNDDSGASGFLYLAHEFQVVSNSQRQIIWSVLLTYATPGKFKELLVGLHGTGPTVTLALQVLHHAVQNVQSGVSVQSSGVSGSNTAGTAKSPHSLLIFLPALTDTIKSDPADSAAAQNLYQLITSLNS